MKDPKILVGRIRVIFCVICCLLALYMAFKFIGRFNQDINATTITYKKYGQTVDDTYPIFSLCFEGDGLFQFNESAIFFAYGIHLSDYKNMLEGRLAFQYDYDPSNRRYVKSSLPPKFEPSNGFREQDLFQIPDVFRSTSFVAFNQSQTVHFGQKDGISVKSDLKEMPLYLSYQSSKQFCLSRNQIYTLDVIRHYDYLTLGPSYLDSNTILKVFIHLPGQLLRSIDTPRFSTILSKVQDDKVTQTLSVSQTTLLRKRSVQNNPCNRNIADHDHFLLESLSNDTGCVPPYWRSITGISSSLRECSSPEQLQKISDLTKDYKKVLTDHETPCLDMFTSAVWSKEEHGDLKICEKCTYLKIVYMDKYYEEISEIKDFSFEDFISGLGGFLGIFLGCSMMQIPYMLGICTFYYWYLNYRYA